MVEQLTYQGTIKIENYNNLFAKYAVSDKDLAIYRNMIEAGEEEEAIDQFVDKYMNSVSELYTATTQESLKKAESGEMKQEEKGKLIRNVVLSTGAASLLLKNNFGKFIKKSYAPTIFKEQGITSIKTKIKTKNAILDATLSEFDTLTTGAMNETQQFVLTNVRQMQRNMIIGNQRLTGVKNLDREVWLFKKRLKQSMPDYYKALEKGAVLKSRTMANGKVVRYKLENYVDMSTRTTLLNVERVATEVRAGINGDNIVEYYLRDNRTLKTGIEREICKTILASSYLGKSVLALDEITGAKLGIMTIDAAKGQGAMGPYCRHSIRSVSRNYLIKVSKLLKAA